MNKITRGQFREYVEDIMDSMYKNGFEDGYSKCNAEHFNSHEYDKGLNDAWECMKSIYSLTTKERIEIFKDYEPYHILKKMTAFKAITKIEEYKKKLEKQCETCCKAFTDECEREKCYNYDYCKWVSEQSENEIRIGDEVQSNYEGGKKYIVTALQCINNPNCYACLGGKKVLKSEVHKTGRHFDQIVEILNFINKEV